MGIRLTRFDQSALVNLSNQTAIRRQMETVAQNLAKMNTYGGSAERVIFQEMVRSTPGKSTSYIQETGILRDLSPGAFEHTGHTFDVALQGRGYFAVQGPDGVLYTRNGHFQMNPSGQLTNAQGYLVLNSANAPISIPPGEAPISIDASGDISGPKGHIAKLGLFGFQDEQQMVSRGNALYESSQAGEVLHTIGLEQGFLEESNIQPIIEMTRMMDLMRSYQMSQNFVEREDDRTKSVIQKALKTRS